MGNRAVIVSHGTNKENAKERIGIYVHWHGGEPYIKKFLRLAKDKIRTVDEDPQYFWSRFCQIICNYIDAVDGPSCLSVGIGIVSDLDTDNGDNGVYYINNKFEITKQTDGTEFN